MQKYNYSCIAELATELCSGLARLRQGFMDRCEELLEMTEPDKNYPLDYLVFKITNYRQTDTAAKPILEGAKLKKDLLTLILEVSESFDLNTSDYDEQVFDTTGLAERFNVSTKTIQRWRNRGLVARKMLFPDGKKRIGFLESSADTFASNFEDILERSSRFSQMTEDEKNEILRRSRRMVSFTDTNLMEVARRISRKTGRAIETIRYTIRNHDNQVPNEAIFPKLLNILSKEEKQKIYQKFLTGTPARNLAQEYGRTRGSIHRIVNEVRALQLLDRSIEYIYSELFDEPGTENDMLTLATMEVNEKDLVRSRPPEGLPQYLKELYEVPLLSAPQEKALFFLYNFYKYRADQLRKRIDPTHIQAHQVKRVESLLLEANVIHNRIVKANLRLVVSIAKKHVTGTMGLFELVSEGNIALMRAVEKFDFSRGFRFSTYASWAIMRNFARSVPKEQNQLARFSTGHEEVLDIAAALENYDPSISNINEVRETIESMLNHLSSRERTILMEHYGLDDSGEPSTFEQIGKKLSISKERARQIELQALEKLRSIAGPQ